MSVNGPVMPVRGYYDALGELRVNPVVVCTTEEDMCRQADAAACDINLIVKAHLRMHGALPPMPEQVYADVSAGWDYRETLERAREAQEYFMQLPSDLRERYGNDPGRFLNEVFLEENAADARLIGLRTDVPEVPNEVPANPPA